MYSQNNEEQILTDFFGDFKGTLLDIGANDGKTFSNSKRLIELGWNAVLVEPSPKTFKKLQELHAGNNQVACVPWAISKESGMLTLHESGAHLPDKSDFSLLSTLKPSEKDRWGDKVEFNEVEVLAVDWKKFYEAFPLQYDFITIDAEGVDIEILTQIDLSNVKVLCIEWNGNKNTKFEILKYCNQYCMTRLLDVNGENIILAQ